MPLPGIRPGRIIKFLHKVWWCQKHLCRHATVNMHLLVALSVDIDIDHDGWKDAGNCGRGQHHLPKQIEGPRIWACGNLAHIPDDGLTSVEIGGTDEKQPTPCVLLRDAREYLRRD